MDVGARDPLADLRELIVVEAEARAHRRACQPGRAPRRRSRGSTASSSRRAVTAEDRGRAAQRAVGEPHAQGRRLVAARSRPSLGLVRRRDRRTPPRSAARTPRCPGTSRSRRAARASGRRRGGGGSPRAAPRPGGRGRGRRGRGCCGPSATSSIRAVGVPVAQRRPRRRRSARMSACSASSSVSAALRAALGERWWRSIAGCRPTSVCSPCTSRPQEASRRLCAIRRVPHRRRGVQQHQVHVAVRTASACSTRRWLTGRRVSPNIVKPRRQRHQTSGSASSARARRLEPLGQARYADGLAQPPPELRLPAGRGALVDAAGLAARPCLDQLRAAHRVLVEQPRDVREPCIAVLVAAAQVAGQRLEPGLLERLLDDLDQRPDQARRLPRVALRCDPAGQRQRSGDQAAGKRELDVRADAVACAGAAAEPGREPLCEPALDPARRHGHDLGREWVGSDSGKQLGERVRQYVCSFCAMDYQHGAEPSQSIASRGRQDPSVDSHAWIRPGPALQLDPERPSRTPLPG